MDTNGKRLRLLYPDIHGLERGKYLFGDVAESGHAAFCIGVYPLTHDREILAVPNTQFDVGPARHRGASRPRHAADRSWEPDTVIGIGDATFRGEPVPIDPRHVLREAVEAWRAMGLEPQIAFELEFYLMEPDGGGGWRPVSASPATACTGRACPIDPSGCVDEMVHDGASRPGSPSRAGAASTTRPRTRSTSATTTRSRRPTTRSCSGC